MVNFAMCFSERDEGDLREIRRQLLSDWDSQLHGQPFQGYDQSANVSHYLRTTATTPAVQADFYAMSM